MAVTAAADLKLTPGGPCRRHRSSPGLLRFLVELAAFAEAAVAMGDEARRRAARRLRPRDPGCLLADIAEWLPHSEARSATGPHPDAEDHAAGRRRQTPIAVAQAIGPFRWISCAPRTERRCACGYAMHAGARGRVCAGGLESVRRRHGVDSCMLRGARRKSVCVPIRPTEVLRGVRHRKPRQGLAAEALELRVTRVREHGLEDGRQRLSGRRAHLGGWSRHRQSDPPTT